MPHLLFHALCHPRLLHAPPPPCLALTLYSSSPLIFFFSVQKHTTSSAVRSPFPFTPFSLTPLLCPLFFSSSLRLERRHYFQPWLCGVDRESRTMAAFEPHGRALARVGVLAASTSFFSTVNSNWFNAASLLLARLAATVD